MNSGRVFVQGLDRADSGRTTHRMNLERAIAVSLCVLRYPRFAGPIGSAAAVADSRPLEGRRITRGLAWLGSPCS